MRTTVKTSSSITQLAVAFFFSQCTYLKIYWSFYLFQGLSRKWGEKTKTKNLIISDTYSCLICKNRQRITNPSFSRKPFVIYLCLFWKIENGAAIDIYQLTKSTLRTKFLKEVNGSAIFSKLLLIIRWTKFIIA